MNHTSPLAIPRVGSRGNHPSHLWDAHGRAITASTPTPPPRNAGLTGSTWSGAALSGWAWLSYDVGKTWPTWSLY